MQDSGSKPVSELEYAKKQLSAMEQERSSFIPHYRELSEFVQPRKGRFFISDRNKGDNRYNSIINSAATFAHRSAQAGLFAGVSSPSRPWFMSETEDPELMEYGPVKAYNYKIDLIMRNILNQSNYYNMTPTMFGELLLFGTGAMSHVDDFQDVARFYTHTAGSYMIAQNERYEIDRFARDIEMTVAQIFERFGNKGGGADNSHISTAVRNQYDRGNYHQWFKVSQLIEPNPDADPTKLDSKFKAYRSWYFEPGTGNTNQKFLSQKGFDEFPVYVPRWSVTGEDIYGTDCPGMTALGDIKGLQIEERRKAQAIDKMVAPPLHGPASVRNAPVENIAGGLTVYDGAGSEGLRPIYEVSPQLQDLRADMAAVEQRIDKAFYVDLFLAITNMEGIQPRNQFELAQRNQERLLQLGPVLERLHGEFLDKLIDRLFNQCVRANILPDPPPELQGKPLKIRYVSSLAQAQRAVATGGIERTAAYVLNLAQAYPDVLDKFDADQSVDEYANLTGAVPTIIVPDDVAMERRAARQKAQQQAAAAEMAKTTSEAVRNVADVKMDDSTLAGKLGKAMGNR